MIGHQIVRYEAGELIFAEGSKGEEFYIVITGAVEIFQGKEGNREHLHTVGPGELFGEVSIVNATPRSATAIARDDATTVMNVDKARFLYLVSQQPGFAITVMETLSRWLRGHKAVQSGSNSTEQLNRKPGPHQACTVIPIAENIWQLRSRTRSSNSYLFRGQNRIMLVDTGLVSSFGALAKAISEIGLSPEAIDMIVLTHEHFDHFAAVPLFAMRRIVAAHRLAAHKIANRDAFAIMSGSFGEEVANFHVDVILDEGAVIDIGGHRLRVFHTPGHSSGSISLLEDQHGLLLTGDLVLAGGHIGGVFGSGNISDTIYSLETLGALRARLHLPGHGPISETPSSDVTRALDITRGLLAETRTIFESLNGQESINKILLSVRDLNR